MSDRIDGTDVPGAQPVARGCGERVAGGCYAECGLMAGGAALEDFLIDPPVLLPASLNLSPLGVQLIERRGANGETVTHIVDWVGAEHYPNVADFLEEVRRFGLSRRLPKNLDWARITPASRHILVHARAHIDNAQEYGSWVCPQANPDHEPDLVLQNFARWEGPCLCCAGLWWRDVEGGQELESVESKTRVARSMPSFNYFAHAAPPEVKPDYLPAFFAAFPISRVVVVRGGDSADTIQAVEAARVPVAEVAR